MTIAISIKGLTDAQNLIRAIPEPFQRSTILKLSGIAYDEAEKGAQAHSKTGALLDSLFNRPNDLKHGRTVGHDLQRAPQALFVNFGTRPHDIRPRDKKALRWSGGGIFHFAKVVHHPGYAGDAYMVRAADTAIREFDRICTESFKEAL